MKYDSGLAQDRAEGQPGHRPVERPEEGVGEEPIGDRVGVDHPPAAGREQLDARRSGLMPHELEGHQEAAQHRDEEVAEGGQEVPGDEPLVDELLVAGQLRFRRLSLSSGSVSFGRRMRVRFRRPVVMRPLEPMLGTDAQRIEQGDGPAEDQVGRRGHPPGEVAVVIQIQRPPKSSGWSHDRMP